MPLSGRLLGYRPKWPPTLYIFIGLHTAFKSLRFFFKALGQVHIELGLGTIFIAK